MVRFFERRVVVLLHTYATASAFVNAEDICDAGGPLEALGCIHVGDAACEFVETESVSSPIDMDADVLRKGEASTYARYREKR